MQITGKVHRIEQPTSREYNGKIYKEQKVIVEITEGQYTQYVQCNISRDNLIGKLQVGEVITADINLRGKEYTKDNQVRNFTSIEIWRFSAEAATTQPTEQYASSSAPAQMLDGSDSLPF